MYTIVRSYCTYDRSTTYDRTKVDPPLSLVGCWHLLDDPMSVHVGSSNFKTDGLTSRDGTYSDINQLILIPGY